MYRPADAPPIFRVGDIAAAEVPLRKQIKLLRRSIEA
jgi:hypothetical protein